MTHDHHDRDTVVVERDSSAMGMILGVVAVWWMTLGPGGGSGTTDGDTQPVPSIEINLPSVAPEGS